MEATIQQNGKEEQPLPFFTLESMENKDQLKNTLETTGEQILLQSSAVITSDSGPTYTWKTANSVQATTNNLKDLVTMDEVVRQSLINDNWKIVESRKSRMISTLPKYSVRSLVPPFLAHHDRISESIFSTDTNFSTSAGQVHAYQEHNMHLYREQNMGQHNGSLLSRSTETNVSHREKSGEANFPGNITNVKSTSLEAEILRSKVSQNNRFAATEAKKSRQMSFNNSLDDDEDEDDDDLFSITLRKKINVPLPAFGDSDDSDENDAGDGGAVPYASQWSMKDKGSLSFYDNLMDLDGKKPLYMLVPDSLGNNTPRVGELELDQLSDLSENEADSNEIPLSDTDDTYSRHSNPHKLSRVDSSMQTDEPFTVPRTKEAGTMTAADIIAEIEAERSGNRRQQSFVPLLSKSTEGSEVDPKFIKRPATCVDVLEGEAISIKCQLNGSQPIDVFWFRDMEEVTQLEEDNRCDIDHFGDTFTLTLFDTTKKDGGQYLCIGVNAQGHCVQGFQVNIQENKNQGISPSFLVGLVNTGVFKGDKVTFGCKVSGYPPPRVLWYHKGERCRDKRKYQIANDGSGGHKLVVRDVGQTNTSFSVVARNVHGEVSSTAEVNIKEKELDDIRMASLNSVSSPYPDVDELVKIAQRVSSTPTEMTPSRTASRFSFSLDKTFEEGTLKRDRDKIHGNTNFKDQVSQLKAHRVENEVFLPLPQKKNDSSDDEQELDVSYPEFERLFEARLISRSQLHSGRVWKKDLVRIQAFLKQISTNSKGSREAGKNEDVLLHVNCGLKSVDPSFYRRDYVVSVDSARRNVQSESYHRENQQTAGRIMRHNSVIPNSTANSVKVVASRSNSLSFKDKTEDLRRSQILKATKEHGDAGRRRAESVDRSSEEDYDRNSDDKFVMPCVKELLSKFGAPLSPEAPVDEVSPLKRIYSLTGRSVPGFVRERLQRQASDSSTADKRGKGKNRNASEDYNKYSLPAQHSTYVDGAPVTLASANIRQTVTNKQVFNHSAAPSIKQDSSININAKELEPGHLKSSHTQSGWKLRSVSKSVSDSQQTDLKGVPSQSKQRDDTVVRRAAIHWQKFIAQHQKPEKFLKTPNGSFNSGND